MRMFYDIESDIVLTEEQLKSEYDEYKGDIEISCGATTFEESIQCATSKDGTLEDLSNVINLSRLMHKLARNLWEYDKHEYPAE